MNWSTRRKLQNLTAPIAPPSRPSHHCCDLSEVTIPEMLDWAAAKGIPLHHAWTAAHGQGIPNWQPLSRWSAVLPHWIASCWLFVNCATLALPVMA